MSLLTLHASAAISLKTDSIESSLTDPVSAGIGKREALLASDL